MSHLPLHNHSLPGSARSSVQGPPPPSQRAPLPPNQTASSATSSIQTVSDGLQSMSLSQHSSVLAPSTRSSSLSAHTKTHLPDSHPTAPLPSSTSMTGGLLSQSSSVGSLSSFNGDAAPVKKSKRPVKLSLNVEGMTSRTSSPAGVGGLIPMHASDNKRPTKGGDQHQLSHDKVSKESRMKLKDEDLEFICELGAGSGGTVSKVLHGPSKKTMARKTINIVVFDESEREKTEKAILRELKILKKCQSPYIVEFYGAFAHEGDISICMEFMELGSFDYILKMQGTVPEDIVACITVPVLKGLMYLYDTHKIVHRDIKPSNILLNAAGEVKIADFGVSKELSNGTMARTFTGTQAYLAPERLAEGRIHSVESDVWSLGLTLMELATGRFPFPPEGHPPLPSVVDLLRYIEEEPAPTLPAGRFSVDFENFCSLCLMKDPDARPPPFVLLQDPFLLQHAKVDLKAWAQTVLSKMK